MLHSAWPAAVTRTRGELHSFGHPSGRIAGADGPSPEEKAAIHEALDLARSYGWEIDPNAEAQAS
ncbi:hypothetical protein H7J07_05155 [Mycobacterium koreense]|uniref:hypothetical protein n=1 Tax=Mycolicibacillus koreensis TaxID=1069220 RepID=UPI00105506BA|nr:hypothetical protein [Mycolicibacillus koreensis]MCV7247612.1 hypothetical protein [Mycolicibacillus koreensis]